MAKFQEFPKLYRLRREIIVTEKIDGTNAQVFIGDDGSIMAGSRKRWLSVESDHFGFWKWVDENKQDLLNLGPGRHFGEWWGAGIQRQYGQDRKRFSLFDAKRWSGSRPACCDVVPILYEGVFCEDAIQDCLSDLAAYGSVAAPGFMKPEGVVVFHVPSHAGFKITLGDDGHKWQG